MTDIPILPSIAKPVRSGDTKITDTESSKTTSETDRADFELTYNDEVLSDLNSDLSDTDAQKIEPVEIAARGAESASLHEDSDISLLSNVEDEPEGRTPETTVELPTAGTGASRQRRVAFEPASTTPSKAIVANEITLQHQIDVATAQTAKASSIDNTGKVPAHFSGPKLEQKAENPASIGAVPVPAADKPSIIRGYPAATQATVPHALTAQPTDISSTGMITVPVSGHPNFFAFESKNHSGTFRKSDAHSHAYNEFEFRPQTVTKSQSGQTIPTIVAPPIIFGQKALPTDTGSLEFQPVIANDLEATTHLDPRSFSPGSLNQFLARAETPGAIARQMAEFLPRLPDKPVEISLNPRELGRVRMSISAAEVGITVHVVAERPETLDLMRRNIEQLAQEFRHIGYENINFAFSEGRTRQDTKQEGNGNNNNDTNTLVAEPDATPSIKLTNGLVTGGLDIRL